jgi:hypothetical protein
MPDDSMQPAFPGGWAIYAAPKVIIPGRNIVLRTRAADRTVLLVRHLVDLNDEAIMISSLVDGRVEAMRRDQFYSAHPVVAAMADPEIL